MFEIIEENPVTLSHVKKMLSDIAKNTELNFRANKTLDYVKEFDLKSVKEVEDIKDKITELNIPRLKPTHIYKILDLMPKTVEELKVILQNSTVTVTNENLKKIIDILNA